MTILRAILTSAPQEGHKKIARKQPTEALT